MLGFFIKKNYQQIAKRTRIKMPPITRKYWRDFEIVLEPRIIETKL